MVVSSATYFTLLDNPDKANAQPLSDGYGLQMSVQFANVPEPSSAALLGLGGLALILRRRK